MLNEVVVEVGAPPDAVWPVVADVERWHEWTRSIRSIEWVGGGGGGSGGLVVGARARVRQPRVPAAVWQVTEVRPGQSFTWESKAGGLTSTAFHEISARGDGGSVVRLAVRHSGPMAWLARLLFAGLTKKYLAMEAAGLKQRVESGVSS